MSKKRAIQGVPMKPGLNAQQGNEHTPTPRSPFSITLTFDPARPHLANLNVMPLGDGNGAQIDDVVTALRLGYEQTLLQKGVWLAQQMAEQTRQVARARDNATGELHQELQTAEPVQLIISVNKEHE